MKKLLLLALLPLLALAQTANVTKSTATNNLTTGFDVGSGQTVTVESGGTLAVAIGGTITLPDNALAVADVTGLQTALDAKLDDSQATATGLSVLGATDPAAARVAVAAAAAFELGQIELPKTGTLYAFGTSQTAGGTSTALGGSAVSGGFILSQYRYPNIVATSNDRALTVQNWGVGGSPMAYRNEQWSNTGTTHFNQWSRVQTQTDSWSGVASLMGGYNDKAEGTSDAFMDVMEGAYVAWIARALIDNYAGLGTSGWTRDGSGGAGFGSFVTTGTDDSILMTGDSGNGVSPFIYKTAGVYDKNGYRYRLDLDAGQYVSITLTSKRAAAVFLETHESGGAYNVYVNDVLWYSGSNAWSGVNSPRRFPQAVWLDRLPANAVIRLEAVGNNVKYLATGWVETDSPSTRARTVVLLSEGNILPDWTATNQQRMARKAAQAVAAFADWPVYFANTSGYNAGEDDVWADDQYHFNLEGHEHLARAFLAAYKPSGRSSFVVRLPDLFTYYPTARAASDGSWIGGVTNQGLIQLWAKDRSLRYGQIEYFAHAGNADSASGSHVFGAYNGSTYSRWARFDKSGRLLHNITGSSLPASDGTSNGAQFQSGLSVGGGTGIARVKHGVGTLTSGVVAVADTTVTANTRIELTRGALNASTNIAELRYTLSAGVGFTVTATKPDLSTETGDASSFSWVSVEP